MVNGSLIKYHFILSLRNLFKNRFFSLINILGLTVGITTFLLITAWVNYELSFDRHFHYSDRIFRFTVEVRQNNGYESHFARCWQSWTREMPDHFPQIKNAAFFAPLRRTAIKKEDVKFNSHQVFRCNQETFEVFGIEIIHGSKNSRFTEPNRVLISKSIYERFFGNQDMIGQRIEMSGAFETEFNDYEVVGIFQDFPENSHFHPEMLVSLDDPEDYEGWAYTYFLLNNKSDAPGIIENFPEFIKNYETEQDIANITPHLQPIHQIHLYSHKDREIENNGDIKIIWLFISIAGIVLILSLINFIHINMALILKRNKQYTIQHILGSSFYQQIISILFESGLILILSAIVGMGLLIFLKSTLVKFIPVTGPYQLSRFILTGALLIVFSIITVSLPQLMMIRHSQNHLLSSIGIFRPTRTKYTIPNRTGLRKGLVILQFTLSVILISGSIYIHKQNKYLFDQRMGKGMGPVVVIQDLNWNIKERNFEFKNQLLQSHLINNVTGSMEPPSGYIMDAMGFEMEGFKEEEEEKLIYVFPVDDNFLDFYRIPLIAGENFSPYNPEIKREEYVVNESAMKFLGFEKPEEILGREFKLTFFIDSIFHGGTIKAVVKDFNFSPLHDKIKPMVMFQKPIWYGTMLIEIDSGYIEESLSFIRSTWDRLYPGYYFDYRFSDDMYLISYENERLQSGISKYLSFLAIFLASLGMLGMSTLLTNARTKEITIRKVNGADTRDIYFMLIRDFTSWIFFAIILAIPLGWWIILKWSENYAYKVPLSWWIFLISGLLALIVAWLSISYQSFKASRQNPVEALRYQ